jgi:hypothetical protein
MQLGNVSQACKVFVSLPNPINAWNQPDSLPVSRDYEGKKSRPEWGLNILEKNLPLLERFRVDEVVKQR